ncbi:uncharacterized protein LOC143922166 [Arctopsyche grandis]|uniref:uncharacterized protein LOC143922166 n=1 Tax=Arctopsyche grandis TaxID=121162 RepID=UPI00406D863E
MTGKKTIQIQEEFVKETEVEEATKIESESLAIVKQARMQLDKALLIQESTICELKKQGEVIKQTKNTAIKILQNSKAASEMQFTIKQESKLLPSFGNVINTFKRWWNRNTKLEKDLEAIQNRKDEDFSNMILEPGCIESSPISVENSTFTEMVPGQNATNNELTVILDTLKKVNAGARNQSEMLKYQKKDIKDIDRLSGYAGDIVEETETQLGKK